MAVEQDALPPPQQIDPLYLYDEAAVRGRGTPRSRDVSPDLALDDSWLGWVTLPGIVGKADELPVHTLQVCAGGLVVARALENGVYPRVLPYKDIAELAQRSVVIVGSYDSRDTREASRPRPWRVTAQQVGVIARIRDRVTESPELRSARDAVNGAWRAVTWYRDQQEARERRLRIV